MCGGGKYKSPQRLRPGDRVRVLRNDNYNARVDEGDLGTVVGRSRWSEDTFEVRMDDYRGGFDPRPPGFDWYLRLTDVEKVIADDDDSLGQKA